MDSTHDVDQDDSNGCANGDVKSSDGDDDGDDDCVMEEQEHNVLSKSKQKPSFSPASASTHPEEAPQRKFGYRRCSRLIVSA